MKSHQIVFSYEKIQALREADYYRQKAEKVETAHFESKGGMFTQKIVSLENQLQDAQNECDFFRAATQDAHEQLRELQEDLARSREAHAHTREALAHTRETLVLTQEALEQAQNHANASSREAERLAGESKRTLEILKRRVADLGRPAEFEFEVSRKPQLSARKSIRNKDFYKRKSDKLEKSNRRLVSQLRNIEESRSDRSLSGSSAPSSPTVSETPYEQEQDYPWLEFIRARNSQGEPSMSALQSSTGNDEPELDASGEESGTEGNAGNIKYGYYHPKPRRSHKYRSRKMPLQLHRKGPHKPQL